DPAGVGCPLVGPFPARSHWAHLHDALRGCCGTGSELGHAEKARRGEVLCAPLGGGLGCPGPDRRWRHGHRTSDRRL
ncbi:uncharacterized protein METZ01_LOCUS232856, partial [marine metagenome]